MRQDVYLKNTNTNINKISIHFEKGGKNVSNH